MINHYSKLFSFISGMHSMINECIHNSRKNFSFSFSLSVSKLKLWNLEFILLHLHHEERGYKIPPLKTCVRRTQSLSPTVNQSLTPTDVQSLSPTDLFPIAISDGGKLLTPVYSTTATSGCGLRAAPHAKHVFRERNTEAPQAQRQLP